MAALDTAHAALALGLPTIVSPRLSESDPRPRHIGVSHHTRTVLSLLLDRVELPAPRLSPDAVAQLRELAGDRHLLSPQAVDLDGYAASGLPAEVMGRGIEDDPLFFAAALASGRALGEAARREATGQPGS